MKTPQKRLIFLAFGSEVKRFITASKHLHRHGLISIQTAAVFLRVILIALALIIPPALVSIFIVDNINTVEIRSDMVISKIFFSSEGLGWFDQTTQKAPVGIIDAEKLSLASKDSQYLNNRISYPDSPMGAKIIIGDATVYYNKDIYDDYAPLAKTGLKGRGGADLTARTLAVLIRSAGHDRPAVAKTEVVTPR